MDHIVIQQKVVFAVCDSVNCVFSRKSCIES